jgi:6-phosphofructokinase
MNKKRIGILTGGGDVPPLNAVLAAAREEACAQNSQLIGFIKGWEGVLQNDFILLNDMAIDPSIGGTILKSSRINLQSAAQGAEKVLQNLGKLNLDGIIVIGGEDTLSNCFLLKDYPQVLISKTIDNDVGSMPAPDKDGAEAEIVNYFTLGHPTAAEKIASFVSMREGLRTTAYSHERIVVVESMGMHAGWLALASSMGHPDFIIIPEFPLQYDLFIEKVRQKYDERKHAIIVVAEGSRWGNGSHISADENEPDEFGHPRFKGAAETLANKLKTDLKKYFATRNVNSVNPSYLYRSGGPNNLDLESAKLLGKEAVSVLIRGAGEPLFLSLQRGEKAFYVKRVLLKAVPGMDALHRFVDGRYYDHHTMNATALTREYLSGIIGEKSPVHGYDDMTH